MDAQEPFSVQMERVIAVIGKSVKEYNGGSVIDVLILYCEEKHKVICWLLNRRATNNTDAEHINVACEIVVDMIGTPEHLEALKGYDSVDAVKKLIGSIGDVRERLKRESPNSAEKKPCCCMIQ